MACPTCRRLSGLLRSCVRRHCELSAAHLFAVGINDLLSARSLDGPLSQASESERLYRESLAAHKAKHRRHPPSWQDRPSATRQLQEDTSEGKSAFPIGDGQIPICSGFPGSPDRAERSAIEQRLKEVITGAKTVYESAKNGYRQALAVREDLGSPHADGRVSFSTAIRAYDSAMWAYTEAVIRYNRFLLDGRLPEGDG